MRGVFEQFYRTWCYAGRSVSGADGWKIRAKSAGLPLPEAEGMADLANYWVPTRLNALTPPGTRLALFRPSPTQAVLVHGVLRPGLVGGRAGVSFEHVIAHLPPAFSAFEAIRLWHSPAWQLDDGDFQPTLGPFLWDDQLRGPESRTDSPNSDAIASAQPEDTASWEDTLAARHLDQYPALPWAHALQACLALGQQRVERLFIAGQDDAIARLLYVVFYCLPDAFRDRLTFSTHENPKGTKGVKIVGVTTFEGEDSDLPSFCYEGQYRALNLFTDRRSDALDLGPFAASAIDWLRCGQYAYLHRVRAQFNELDPADNPGARELDLLSQEVECGEEASGKPKFLLNLCSSRALARSRIIRPDQLASFLACARAEPTFESRLAGELSAWLPGNAPAAAQFLATMAQLAYAELSGESPLDALGQTERFARRVAPALGDQFLERLSQLCLSGPADQAPPPIEIRLRLLETWLPPSLAADPQIPSPALKPLPETALLIQARAAHWLEVDPLDLVKVLRSPLPPPFKLQALSACLNSAGRLETEVAEALAAVVVADSRLNRNLFFHLPRWRQTPGTIAAAIPQNVLSRIIEAFNQSLTLTESLRDAGSQLLEILELWQVQNPALVPQRMQSILALGRYLRQPSASAALPGELLSHSFWWGDGAKEEAVNAALDQFLGRCSLEDFERALEWFGRGAWARTPLDLISLADHRLTDPTPPRKSADPVLQEAVALLACVLREWDQARKTALRPAFLRETNQEPVLGARSIATLGRIALCHLPEGSFLKSPAGRDLLRLLTKETHLIGPEQKARFAILRDLSDASAAKEPHSDSLLVLAQSSLDASLDSELRQDVSKLFLVQVAGHPRLLRPFLRKFFDSRAEPFTRQFLPAFLDSLADREAKTGDSSVTEEFALGLKDLGNDLTASDPDLAERLKLFVKRLPPRSRERFDRILRQPDTTGASLPRPRSLDARPAQPLKKPPSGLRRRAATVWRWVVSEPALYVYFYALVFAAGVLAYFYWHEITHFFKQVFFP